MLVRTLVTCEEEELTGEKQFSWFSGKQLWKVNRADRNVPPPPSGAQTLPISRSHILNEPLTSLDALVSPST